MSQCSWLVPIAIPKAAPHGYAAAAGATLHRLRHAVATTLVERCDLLQAQHRLGHRDASTTLRIYSHAMPLNDSDAVDALDQLYRPPLSAVAGTLSGMGEQRQPLFDAFERTDATPSTHQESSFEFLNRVASDYWEHPRALMEEWLDRIPSEQEYNDLRQRFRSRDDEQFRSAFLELYLHECLIRAGYTVTIHPEVEGTSRRPDFLAERGDLRFFIEAIALGSTPAKKAAAQRRAVLFDTVNRLDDPNFMLWLDELEEGSSPPASALLRKDLRRWLAELDPCLVGSGRCADEAMGAGRLGGHLQGGSEEARGARCEAQRPGDWRLRTHRRRHHR